MKKKETEDFKSKSMNFSFFSSSFTRNVVNLFDLFIEYVLLDIKDL